MSNWGGQDSIPKLQPQAERSNNILLDGAAAPRAAIDAHSLRRCALSVEPSAPNQEVPIAKRPECIERIPRRNHHTVARPHVLLSDLLKGLRVVGNCFQRLRDAGHGAILGRALGQVNEAVPGRLALRPQLGGIPGLLMPAGKKSLEVRQAPSERGCARLSSARKDATSQTTANAMQVALRMPLLAQNAAAM